MLARASATLLSIALVATPSIALAQPTDVPTPLTFDAALAYAATRNLAVDAARQGRAIREAQIHTAPASVQTRQSAQEQAEHTAPDTQRRCTESKSAASAADGSRSLARN